MRKFKYISNITEDELNDNYVISCINENNMPCILVKNSLVKTVTNFYSTDNLEVKFNSVLESNGNSYYFHIITSKRNDLLSNKQFETVFDYIFNKIETPVDEDELNSLFGSIEEYFRITPDPNNKKTQIGLFGELLTVKYLYQNGYQNVVNKYHKNFFLKHDIEINNELRIEIKATTSSNRIHTFKHDQIRRKDVDVIVSSLLLEEAQEGLSLFNLFEQIININTDYENIFSLYKLMKSCGLDEDHQGVVIAEDQAILNLKFFNAADLPQLDIDSVDGVSKITYDVDCTFAAPIPINNVIDLLNSNDNA